MPVERQATGDKRSCEIGLETEGGGHYLREINTANTPCLANLAFRYVAPSCY